MSDDRAALGGTNVVELADGIAAPFAARLLADLGADVVKVEPSEGDPMRAQEPFFDHDGTPKSALFEYLNWNKLSAVLDPAQLTPLLRTADILIIGDEPGLAERWGLDPAAFPEQFPDLAVVVISPFGRTGPRRDWHGTDLILQAASGLMSIGGTSDREPLRRGLRASSYEAGLTAAYVAIFALLAARAGRGGTLADVAMAECLTSELVSNIPAYSFTGAIPGRRQPASDPLSTGEPIPVRDGYAALQINSHIRPAAFADLLGEPRLREPRFDTNEGRVEGAADLVAILSAALDGEGSRDFFVRASAAGLLTGFVQSPEQLLDCPQLAAREAFVTMPGLLAGRPWRMPAVTAVLSATPVRIRRPAPALGQHTASVTTRAQTGSRA